MVVLLIKVNKLEELSKEIVACRRCPLYKNATRAVPGEGNPQADIMFIGEGPGFFEDREGRPFVGQAGQLLDELLKLIKLDRKEVFITNILKHRPPQNRDPLPVEIEACQSFLDEQIETIGPKIIVTLGRFSMAKFLPGEFISRIHGLMRLVEWKGKKIMIMPMYHPAAALRGASVMAAIKEDFLKIPALLKQLEPVEEAKEEEIKKSEESSEQLNLIN